jgi:alkylhydroperoxidase family enzyme
VLRSKFFDSDKVAAIVRDYHNAGLEPEEEALMAFAEKVLTNSYQISQDDIDILKTHGLSEEDIFNIALTVTSRSFFSRVVDAIGFKPPAEWLTKIEEFFGKDTYQALNVGRTYG